MTDTYNPFAERNVKHPTTDLETFIHIVKGALGAGMLAMPKAFMDIGLWLGIPATILISILATYCIHMLVKASQTLCFRCRIPRLTFAETADQAFRNDPKELVKWAVTMRYVVNVFQVVNSLGCVCVYFVTAGKSIEQVVSENVEDTGISLRVWILMVGSPMLLLSLIHDLKYLVPFSMVANILVFISLLIICYFIFEELPDPSKRTAVANVMSWPSFFSISVFALEIIGIILPCENEMKTPQHFTGCPSVLVAGMSVVSFLYTFMGFFGYLKYGAQTTANISLNLPVDSIWGACAKVMIATAIYFTILLQFYVAIQIVLRGLLPKIPTNWQLVTEICVRIGLMLVCLAIAVLFPDLGPFISLIGAVTFSTLGLTIPAIIDLVVFRVDPGYGFLKIYLIKDILIIIFGLCIFVFGTLESLNEFKVEKFMLK